MSVATVGFTASIVILSIPLFGLALLVRGLPSGGRSLEPLSEE